MTHRPFVNALVFVLCLAFPCVGQEGEPPALPTQPTEPLETVAATLSTEEVQARLSRVESDAGIPEAVKTEAVALLRQALEQLTQAATWTKQTEDYRRGREEAPSRLESARKELQELKDSAGQPPDLREWEASPLEKLSQDLANAEAELKGLQEAVRKLEEEARQRADRRTAIPELLAAANGRAEAANRELGKAPAPKTPPQLQLARQTVNLAQRQSAQAEILAYQEELQFYDARRDSLAARTDAARLRVTQKEAGVAVLRELVANRRAQEAAEQRKRAEAELEQAPQAVRDLAERNAALARERSELTEKIRRAQQDLESVREVPKALSAQTERMRGYAKLPETASLVGSLMRDQRADLTALRRHERDLTARQEEFARTRVRIDELEEERTTLLSLDTAVDARLAEIRGANPSLSVEVLRQRLVGLLTDRRDALDALRQDYDSYSTTLIDLVGAYSKLRAQVKVTASFIEERVLWIPSTEPITRMRLPAEGAEIRRAAAAVLVHLGGDLRDYWPLLGLVSLAFVALAAWQPRLRRDLRRTGDLVSKPLTDSYGLTLRAMLDTVLIAAPIPLLLWLIAWRCHVIAGASDAATFELANALSLALWDGGALLLALLTVRHGCRRYGIAARHFRWDMDGVGIFRRHLLWLIPVVTPLAVFVVTTEGLANTDWRDSIGRAAFLCVMGLLAAFVLLAFAPRRGVLSRYYRRLSILHTARVPWIAYLLLLACPVGFGIASALGYHYTAVELMQRLVWTLSLTLALIVAHALAVRWVFYTQRKLAIEEARRKRTEQAAAEDRGEDSLTATDVVLDDAALNIGFVGDQTRKLLSSLAWLGLIVVVWVSWADLLPALRFLDDVTLWSYTTELARTGGEASGDASAAVTVVRSVTLASLIVAAVIVLVTFVLARNMPGLMEITLLRRLPLDASVRFAINAVSRYVITIVGLVAAFGAIGIGWSKVQWLVAAITVGLGFGLQEIFANLVSGLILLFERPIRIGDTVTVGSITGTVSRIRIRATTITDWDRKELVIPNKEFVTGQVVNWTLTDRIVRVVVRVGIAYGSDVRLAKAILRDICERNERVLEQPKPQVWFLEFGESSLNFEVRAFAKDLDDWLFTRDALHCEIDAAFREAGIEIAFPQRDIHVRSIRSALQLAPDERLTPPRPTAQSHRTPSK